MLIARYHEARMYTKYLNKLFAYYLSLANKKSISIYIEKKESLELYSIRSLARQVN